MPNRLHSVIRARYGSLPSSMFKASLISPPKSSTKYRTGRCVLPYLGKRFSLLSSVLAAAPQSCRKRTLPPTPIMAALAPGSARGGPNPDHEHRPAGRLLALENRTRTPPEEEQVRSAMAIGGAIADARNQRPVGRGQHPGPAMFVNSWVAAQISRTAACCRR